MLKGDIVVVNFSYCPIIAGHDFITEKSEEFFNDVANGIYPNIWEIKDCFSVCLYNVTIHYSCIKHIPTEHMIFISNEYLLKIDIVRDKKINDLLC